MEKVTNRARKSAEVNPEGTAEKLQEVSKITSGGNGIAIALIGKMTVKQINM